MQQPVVKRIASRSFDNSYPCWGFKNFIDWNNLLAHHVINNAATFIVEINKQPLMRKSTPLPSVQLTTGFQFTIKNASKLVQCSSPVLNVREIHWQILCKRNENYLQTYLGADKRDLQENWAYPVVGNFSLLPFDTKVKPTIRHFNCYIDVNKTFDGIERFVKWPEFIRLENRFILDDESIVVVQFKVFDPVAKRDLQRGTISPKIRCDFCTIHIPGSDIW